MIIYLESFFAALILSAIFGIGGVGSSIALIPFLNFLGVSFNLAKAVGLLVNTFTTSTATLLNIRMGLLKFGYLIPFVIFSMIFAPLGVYFAKIMDVNIVKIIFIIFLFYSAYKMVFKKATHSDKQKKYDWVLIPLGILVGFLSGLLGIGGGAMIIPTLIWMGIESKKIPIFASFMITFTTMAAFFSYAFMIKLDWILILVTSIAAILGGYIGNIIMHKTSPKRMNQFLALQLVIIGLKMLYDILH